MRGARQTLARITDECTREVKQGWRFAADAARIADENAINENCNHMLGAVFVATGSDLGVVVDKEERAVMSVPGNEGRITRG